MIDTLRRRRCMSGADTNSPTPLNNVKEETMGWEWLQGEPTLEDVLSDPIVQALMKRDHVDPNDLRMFFRNMKSALEGQGVPAAPPVT
jgi:hypothetical protein